MNFIKMVTLVVVTAFLSACAIPYQNQSGGFAANIHGPNGSFSVGGVGSTGGQAVAISNGGCNGMLIRHPNGQLECRACQIGVWNGQTCLVQSQPMISGMQGGQRMCPNPLSFVNGGWRSNGYFPC
jgi:hypothetical protein